MYFYTNQLRLPEALSASLVGRVCWSRGLLSALASSTVTRTEISTNEGDAFDPE
jgi:hypothetical protein